jgi:hypothetical protein
MPSPTEAQDLGQSPKAPHFRAGFERWNRKLHFYAGLFFLFFMWLFSVSGLVLNHPAWAFAESWNNRHETNYVREIKAIAPEVKDDLPQALEIMKQLGIEGEILWTTPRTNPNLFIFQVRRPGHFFFLNADLARQSVAIRHSEVNLWGVIKVLHVFSGAPTANPPNTRDWALTAVWAFSMDAVAAGLIFMVLSSLYMWWKFPEKRLPGLLALGLGTLSCGLFCVGLRWLF